MYTAFYGLREKPFALSPDPRFLYLAGSHREALAHLLYGIEQGEGFISVTGEVGTGKTTLCRTLLERLDGDTELAFLFNPSRTALELLQSICAEFDLPAEGLTRRSLMVQLDGFLVEQKRLGRRVLLIIDEAQTLSEKTLEQVRLLSNLETSREKLIQILLLGQPELDRKLDGRGLRQLRQRISVRWKLEALSAEETRAYVRHRVAIAAGKPKDLFSDAALREVYRRTGGIPRLVNQLCDRALLAGYAGRESMIRPALIRAAAREIPDARLRRDRELLRPTWMRPSVVAAASLALVLLASFAGMQVGRHGLPDAMQSLFRGIDLFANHEDADSPLPAVGAKPSAAEDNSSRITPTPAGIAAPESAFNPDNPRHPDEVAPIPTLARMRGYLPSSGPGSEPGNAMRGQAMASLDQERSSPSPSPRFVASAVALPIPQAVRSGVLALAPGLLANLLANRDEIVALAESQRAILERFGRRVPKLASGPTDRQTLQAGLEERGLTATPFDGGSIDLLRRLDHPVLLPLRSVPSPSNHAAPAPGRATAPRWLAVTGFAGDRAQLAGLISDRIVTVPVRELAEHWLETGIIVWERYEPVPDLMALGGQGRGVLWLQRSLSELQYFTGSANGSFASDTQNALIDFQRQSGLVADGIAGPLTQIALYAKLNRYPVPRLSAATPSKLSDPRRRTSALPGAVSAPSPSLFQTRSTALRASTTPTTPSTSRTTPTSMSPASPPASPTSGLSPDSAQRKLTGVRG